MKSGKMRIIYKVHAEEASLLAVISKAVGLSPSEFSKQVTLSKAIQIYKDAQAKQKEAESAVAKNTEEVANVELATAEIQAESSSQPANAVSDSGTQAVSG